MTAALADILEKLNHGVGGVKFDIDTVRRVSEAFDPETHREACLFLEAVRAAAHADGYRKGYTDARFDSRP
ncbi:hypothetical protein [Streptomyces sp. NPDC002855]|uniref:hypothetical protein n=1 Tax=Streptomyces sp. NPDC002855 TaxID=3154437 RepID=UPI003328AE91